MRGRVTRTSCQERPRRLSTKLTVSDAGLSGFRAVMTKVLASRYPILVSSAGRRREVVLELSIEPYLTSAEIPLGEANWLTKPSIIVPPNPVARAAPNPLLPVVSNVDRSRLTFRSAFGCSCRAGSPPASAVARHLRFARRRGAGAPPLGETNRPKCRRRERLSRPERETSSCRVLTLTSRPNTGLGRPAVVPSVVPLRVVFYWR
jgi:hypothetical protein